MKEEFKNTRAEYQKNLERLEYNIMSSDRRLKKGLGLVDQHCCKDETESRMLPLYQECVKDSPINDEETRNNREDEMESKMLP